MFVRTMMFPFILLLHTSIILAHAKNQSVAIISTYCYEFFGC